MEKTAKQSSMSHRTKKRLALGLAFALAASLPLPAYAHHRQVVNKTDRGITERVSVSSSGEEGDADSPGCSGFEGKSVSDNGRFVAFTSRAGNLHPADVNGQLIQDVFVFDRKKDQLDLVSAMPSGTSFEPPLVPPGVTNLCSPVLEGGQVVVPEMSSNWPVISGNGRYVAFTSTLPLTGLDDREAPPAPVDKVFVRDLKTKTTRLVSRTQDGLPATGDSIGGSISDNGRFVAFTSAANNLVDEEVCPSSPELVPGVPSPLAAVSGCSQVYLRDLRKDETRLVSRSSEGKPSSWSRDAAISGNGRFVAFATHMDDASGPEQIFVHDRKNVATELISISRDEGPGNHDSIVPSLSDNGRFVTFTSWATDLVPANPPTTTSPHPLRCMRLAYVRDRKTGRTERVSASTSGTPFTYGTGGSLSDDGRYVLLESRVSDTVARAFTSCDDLRYVGDDSHNHDRYVLYDRETGQLDWIATSISHSWESGEGSPPEAWIGGLVMNANARVVVGSSRRSDVVEGDTNDATDIFVRDIGNYPLGTGPVGGAPPRHQEPSDDRICVEDVCLPPGAAVISSDPTDDVADPLTRQGANLYGASLAHRPELDDLYVAIELEHMGPSLGIGPGGIVTGGNSSLLYGLRFSAGGGTYEVRITSVLGGTFGLFDCTSLLACTEIASLRGGYGTTGERVVFSLPLGLIGLEEGGELKDAEAFSGLGSYFTGSAKTLDTVRLR